MNKTNKPNAPSIDSSKEKTTGNSQFMLHKAYHDPRAGALVVLKRILEGNAESQNALDSLLEQGSMVPADKKLCTELTYGTLRNYERLNWCMGFFLKDTKKIPSEMILVVIMTLYSMMFLRIPHRASVDWAVSHIKNRFGVKLGNVANGVLRSLQLWLPVLQRKDIYEECTSTKQEFAALWYSTPAWIVELWFKAYGEEQALILLELSNLPAWTGIRFNTSINDYKEHASLLKKEALEIYSSKAKLNNKKDHISGSKSNCSNLSHNSVNMLKESTPIDAMLSSSGDAAKANLNAIAPNNACNSHGQGFERGTGAFEGNKNGQLSLSLELKNIYSNLELDKHLESIYSNFFESKENFDKSNNEDITSLSNDSAKNSQPETACGGDVLDVMRELDSSFLALASSVPPRLYGLIKEGRASRMSPSSYHALMCLMPNSCMLPIWDCCAGRGGKTMTLLERGLQVALASDNSKKRLQSLPLEFERLKIDLEEPYCVVGGADKIFIEQASSKKIELLKREDSKILSKDLHSSLEYKNIPTMYGTILIDAPCSGLGTLARKPDIKFKRSLKDIDGLIKVQQSLLANAAKHLMPNGHIIYITCTLNPKENEEQINLFLKDNPSFVLEKIYYPELGRAYGEFFFGVRLKKS